MSDFAELESELTKLRPAQPSAEFISRIEIALAQNDDAAANVIAPPRFQLNWLGLGLGLAVAATFLILARIDFHPPQKTKIAAAPSVHENATAQLPSYQTAGLTQVVYNREDEGLIFPRGSQQPVRRLRTEKRETLQWRDARTGAHLWRKTPGTRDGRPARSALRRWTFQPLVSEEVYRRVVNTLRPPHEQFDGTE